MVLEQTKKKREEKGSSIVCFNTNNTFVFVSVRLPASTKFFPTQRGTLPF
jgi:hypothetical protein